MSVIPKVTLLLEAPPECSECGSDEHPSIIVEIDANTFLPKRMSRLLGSLRNPTLQFSESLEIAVHGKDAINVRKDKYHPICGPREFGLERDYKTVWTISYISRTGDKVRLGQYRLLFTEENGNYILHEHDPQAKPWKSLVFTKTRVDRYSFEKDEKTNV